MRRAKPAEAKPSRWEVEPSQITDQIEPTVSAQIESNRMLPAAAAPGDV
jgi:hypothetical protein